MLSKNLGLRFETKAENYVETQLGPMDMDDAKYSKESNIKIHDSGKNHNLENDLSDTSNSNEKGIHTQKNNLFSVSPIRFSENLQEGPRIDIILPVISFFVSKHYIFKSTQIQSIQFSEYLSKVYQKVSVPSGCIEVALWYFVRMAKKQASRIFKQYHDATGESLCLDEKIFSLLQAQHLYTICIMQAAKTLQDHPNYLSDWATVMNVDFESLHERELQILELLDWNVFIHPKEIKKYWKLALSEFLTASSASSFFDSPMGKHFKTEQSTNDIECQQKIAQTHDVKGCETISNGSSEDSLNSRPNSSQTHTSQEFEIPFQEVCTKKFRFAPLPFHTTKSILYKNSPQKLIKSKSESKNDETDHSSLPPPTRENLDIFGSFFRNIEKKSLEPTINSFSYQNEQKITVSPHNTSNEVIYKNDQILSLNTSQSSNDNERMFYTQKSDSFPSDTNLADDCTKIQDPNPVHIFQPIPTQKQHTPIILADPLYINSYQTKMAISDFFTNNSTRHFEFDETPRIGKGKGNEKEPTHFNFSLVQNSNSNSDSTSTSHSHAQSSLKSENGIICIDVESPTTSSSSHSPIYN